jgi:hypothetical protein
MSNSTVGTDAVRTLGVLAVGDSTELAPASAARLEGPVKDPGHPRHRRRPLPDAVRAL